MAKRPILHYNYMSKEMTAFSLWQGDMHMSGKVPREFMEKMVEISNRDPEGT